MKQKIEELIKHHKTAKLEVFTMLEELSQIDESKLDYKEIDSLRYSKIRYSEEVYFRQLFIQELKDLL